MNDSSAKLLEFIRNTLCSQELILANEFLLFSEQSWKPIFLACIRMQVQLLLWLNFYRKLLTWIVARMENCCDWRKHSCNPVRISPKWDPVSSPGPQRAAATIHWVGHSSAWENPQVHSVCRTTAKSQQWSLGWYSHSSRTLFTLQNEAKASNMGISLILRGIFHRYASTLS